MTRSITLAVATVALGELSPEITGGTAIACEARIAVNVDKLTELAIIRLKEH